MAMQLTILRRYIINLSYKNFIIIISLYNNGKTNMLQEKVWIVFHFTFSADCYSDVFQDGNGITVY